MEVTWPCRAAAWQNNQEQSHKSGKGKEKQMSDKKSKYCFSIQDLPKVNLTEESAAHLLLSDRLLISFIENPPGCDFPVHAHDAEQILVILEGEEEHICGDERFNMSAGDVCVHPANVPHSGYTKSGFKGIDIFCPPRKDHVDKLKAKLKEMGREDFFEGFKK
jgi:quercetin dioxygenase-like cupin family protein